MEGCRFPTAVAIGAASAFLISACGFATTGESPSQSRPNLQDLCLREAVAVELSPADKAAILAGTKPQDVKELFDQPPLQVLVAGAPEAAGKHELQYDSDVLNALRKDIAATPTAKINSLTFKDIKIGNLGIRLYVPADPANCPAPTGK